MPVTRLKDRLTKSSRKLQQIYVPALCSESDERAESHRHFHRICQLFPYGRILERSRFIRRSRQLIWLVQLIRQAMNKQLLPFESKNGNYEGEATQVLVLLSNYYADKKLFDENTDEYGNILILKDSSIISKLSAIPDLLKRGSSR